MSHRLRVLVVDDEPIARLSARLIVGGEGHVVVEADGGGAATRALSTDADGFDAVLVDRHMPDIDGAAVLRLARGLPRAPSRVVCLTGSADAPARAAILAEGFDAVLSKPLGAPALRHTLASIVPRAPRASTPRSSGPSERDLAQRAIAAADTALDALRQALEREDHEAIKDAAHRLGSLALQVGRTHLGHYARALEIAARKERPSCRVARAELERARARDGG